MKSKALVVGSGLTGATAAWWLKTHGWDVTVCEQSVVIGGNIRGERMCGVEYEPHGAHIFHTANMEAAGIIEQHAKLLPYRHKVKTQVNGREVSWPPQVSELAQFDEWTKIQSELESLPSEPDTTNFETYATSIMGATLYEWFIYGYTVKQWGRDPKELSSSFAPKRIDLRADGYKDLFRDPIQGWPQGGWITIVDSMLKDIPVMLNSPQTANTVNPGDWDAVIVTAALDKFLGLNDLEWRGVRLEHVWNPGERGTLLSAGVVNQPDVNVPYTRRIETKHMSGQSGKIEGTVISYEYPGAPARHYPIDDVAGNNRRLAQQYKQTLQAELGSHVIPAGRLANYVYIDTDQAIMQGLNAARHAIRGMY